MASESFNSHKYPHLLNISTNGDATLSGLLLSSQLQEFQLNSIDFNLEVKDINSNDSSNPFSYFGSTDTKATALKSELSSPLLSNAPVFRSLTYSTSLEPPPVIKSIKPKFTIFEEGKECIKSKFQKIISISSEGTNTSGRSLSISKGVDFPTKQRPTLERQSSLSSFCGKNPFYKPPKILRNLSSPQKTSLESGSNLVETKSDDNAKWNKGSSTTLPTPDPTPLRIREVDDEYFESISKVTIKRRKLNSNSPNSLMCSVDGIMGLPEDSNSDSELGSEHDLRLISNPKTCSSIELL